MKQATNKPNGKGINRVLKAGHCSIMGFKAAFRYESAFRQELMMTIIMLPFAFIIGANIWESFVLVSALLLVLLTELVNSAIEAVVDRISLEQHVLSGRAKDMGSAAVFISLLICTLTWLGALLLPTMQK
ncbi:diacylglycerol kinase [Colwellia sp. E150_009]